MTGTTKEQAEIEKLLAETEAQKEAALSSKLDQELKRLDQDIKKAEARRTLAQAVEAERNAELAEYVMRERQRLDELAGLQDYYAYDYTINGVFNERSVNCALDVINTWHRRDPNSPWNITINSPGGDGDYGFHLFDQLGAYSKRRNGTHHITMTVRGMAASMGGILLQAADERVMGANAFILIHQVSSWAQGSLGDLKDQIKRLDMLTDNVIDLFMERANTKNITRKQFISSWNRTDWWITATKAVEYGFADRLG